MVEVLLALTLTTLLVALTGRIAVSTFQARREVRGIIARLDRQRLVFDRIAEDLGALLLETPGDHFAVGVFGTPRQVLQLNALAPISSADGALHQSKRPATVRYRLVGRPSADGRWLVREVIDRTSPNARPVQETISRHVTGFQVEVLHGDKWTRDYPSSDRESAPPAAVRVTLRWVDSEQAITRTLAVPKES